MAKFTEEEIQQTLLAILDAATGRQPDTGVRKRNPIAIQLPSGRKVDIDTAVPICEGIGLSIRDHADLENAATIQLRIDRKMTPFDIMECGLKLGLVTGEGMKSGRILKQSESLPVPD